MKWADLTILQISTMLLEEEPRKLWNAPNGQNSQKGLWDRLREKNIHSSPKPMFLMAYALAIVAVWHALSEKRDAPNVVGLKYLEDDYYLKFLFDTSKSLSEWEFADYLAQAGRQKGKDHPARVEIAKKIVDEIKKSYVNQPFQPEKTFRALLNEIKEKGTFGEEFVMNLMGPLNEPIPGEINAPHKIVKTEREKELDEKLKQLLSALGPKPSCDSAAPEKGRADIEWDLNCTFARSVRCLIENHVRLLLFTGAPGAGKTYAAELLARYYGAPLPHAAGSAGPEPPLSAAANSDGPSATGSDKLKSYDMVQFHPSYDYTDFVEGLRPIQGDNREGMRFVKLDGSFKAFCRRVAEHGKPSEKYFFIIDEINRAELSKVFGELMSRLEPDKRGPAYRIKTQYQNLNTYDQKRKRDLEGSEDVFSDYKGGFYVPENVYIIGTMNDIDRSVESMDFALRRRFTIKEAVVDEDMLLLAFHSMGFSGNEARLTDRVSALNRVIAGDGAVYGLNRQYFISHGQFAGLPTSVDRKRDDAQSILNHVWTYRLDPLLREYLRGVNEDKADTFVQACKAAFLGETASITSAGTGA